MPFEVFLRTEDRSPLSYLTKPLTLGLVLAGAIAEVYSTPTAWMVGAVFLVVAVIQIGILTKRLAAESE